MPIIDIYLKHINILTNEMLQKTTFYLTVIIECIRTVFLALENFKVDMYEENGLEF